MGRGHNQLKSAELFELALYIRELKAPFATWPEAYDELSKVVGRRVTHSNVETACSNAKRDIADVVKTSGSNSSHPFANMMALVRDLETRVKKLEAMLE